MIELVVMEELKQHFLGQHQLGEDLWLGGFPPCISKRTVVHKLPGSSLTVPSPAVCAV